MASADRFRSPLNDIVQVILAFKIHRDKFIFEVIPLAGFPVVRIFLAFTRSGLFSIYSSNLAREFRRARNHLRASFHVLTFFNLSNSAGEKSPLALFRRCHGNIRRIDTYIAECSRWTRAASKTPSR